jgi:hypothetical protein
MKKIFVRSPYTIAINEVGQIGSKVELFIWNANISEPTEPTYTMSKRIVSETQTENVYNISNKCVEFINEKNPIYTSIPATESFKNWCFAKVKRYKETSSNVFVLIDEESFICFDGYTSFLPGANQDETTDNVPLFNTDIKIYKQEGTIEYVNVWLDNLPDILATEWVLQRPDLTLTAIASNGSLFKIPYSLDGKYTLYKQTNRLIEQFNFVVESICEPKYTPIVCSFINRFGGWSFLTFFKAHQKSIEVKSSTFNLMPESWNYDTFVGSNKQFNFNGTKKITCNTGWVDENYSELIQDLLVSQVVLLDDIPVLCKSTSSEEKTQLKDKNINYTINFEYNFNLLNDVI